MNIYRKVFSQQYCESEQFLRIEERIVFLMLDFALKYFLFEPNRYCFLWKLFKAEHFAAAW